jgi:hypothetical protein
MNIYTVAEIAYCVRTKELPSKPLADKKVIIRVSEFYLNK